MIGLHSLGVFVPLLILAGLCVAAERPDRAAWMRQAKWRVMTHHLADWKARGGFLVSASPKGGKTESVQIRSQLGGECRLRNPWPDRPVTLRRDSVKSESLSGSLRRFATSRDETIAVTHQQY